MKLYDEFKDSLVGELNNEEIRELAKFAAALSTVKRKRDAEAVSGLLKEAAAEITDVDDFYYVGNLMGFLEKNAAEGGKQGFDLGRAAQMVGPAMAAATAIAPLAARLYGGMQAKSRLKKTLMDVQSDHPSLFSPAKVEQTKRNFGVIKDFAPHIAQNSLVAGNVLARMDEYGPRAMDINTVKEMAETQKAVHEGRGKGKGSALGDVLKAGQGLSLTQMGQMISKTQEQQGASTTPQG